MPAWPVEVFVTGCVAFMLLRNRRRAETLRVLILHNSVSPHDSASDRDVLVQVAAVSAALAELGHAFDVAPCDLDLEAVRRKVHAWRPDVVFQLVESLAGSDRMAIAVTSLIDVLEVPYTGSGTESLLLTNHKLLAKERLHRHGLPTPAWIGPSQGILGKLRPECEEIGAGAHSQFLVKAVLEHASLGLSDDSLVPSTGSAAAIRARVDEQVGRMGRPCFAEAYVEGREFNLSVLAGASGPEVLPAAEIDFSSFPDEKLRIVGYRAKWEEDSFEYVHSPRRFDFPSADQGLLDQLAELSRACWDVFGLGGYARVDFRVDAQGRPWILEVNANPCISPDAGFAAALDRAAISYPAAIARILDDACRRWGRAADCVGR
jgi:D-alanine-D-alanine ligase